MRNIKAKYFGQSLKLNCPFPLELLIPWLKVMGAIVVRAPLNGELFEYKLFV
jgi:hypothetical protein